MDAGGRMTFYIKKGELRDKYRAFTSKMERAGMCENEVIRHLLRISLSAVEKEGGSASCLWRMSDGS